MRPTVTTTFVPLQGLPQLINEFHSLLGLAGAERPLVVLLDGLDELSEEHSADLSWISTPLPPNVHLILSATTDSPCTHTLQVSTAEPKIKFQCGNIKKDAAKKHIRPYTTYIIQPTAS